LVVDQKFFPSFLKVDRLSSGGGSREKGAYNQAEEKISYPSHNLDI